MTDLLDILANQAFWVAVLRIATPLILGTLGVLLCERAGVLNLGIEGIMVAGAFTGWLAVFLGAPLWVGVAVAALTGAAFGLLHAFLTVVLRVNPVIAYLSDHFQRPAPFQPTVVIDVEPVLEQILDQMVCHRSQFFEWLPYTLGQEASFPTDPTSQRAYAKDFYCRFNGPLADRFREQIIKTYGEVEGKAIRWIEAFEPCEYGSPLTEEARKRLFPMIPV